MFLICSLVVNLVSLRDLRMAAVPLLGLDSDHLKPHVLAVDDSVLDRKIIERLLTNSSCKGIYYSFHFSLTRLPSHLG